MAENPSPLVRYLKVQAVTDREIQSLLNSAYAASVADLDRLASAEGPGGAVRAAQVRQAQAAIQRRMAVLWDAVGNATEAGRARAAAAAVDDLVADMTPYLRSAGLSDDSIRLLTTSMKDSAERNIDNAISRVTTSQIPLSERVYDSGALVSGKVGEIVTSAIARGASAREIANEVRGYIRPDTPGGVKYAAQRLGRTELNNAFHATQVAEAQKNPMVQAMRWHLSGSHPRPDECNTYAEQGDIGGGLWSVGRVPAKPHPNCLCYMTAEMPSRADFIKAYKNGEYDSYIDDVIAESGGPFLSLIHI